MKKDRLRYVYARGVLAEAVETLATGPGDARERIVRAFSSFAILGPDDFPEEFRAEWALICARCTERGPLVAHDGSITLSAPSNTMHYTRRATASGIAKKIWNLYRKMDDLVDSHDDELQEQPNQSARPNAHRQSFLTRDDRA